MRRTPSHGARTRWRWSGRKHIATARQVRRAPHRAAWGPVRDAQPRPPSLPRAVRRAGGFESDCGAMTSLDAGLLLRALRSDLHADSAVARESAGLVDHRLPAHPKLL